MVGLPGRGKTWLCHKLRLYLNWLGHATKHINVGLYRRLQNSSAELQDADFFDASNPLGIEARGKALRAALDELHAYLASDEGQIVIFDATNTTEERRQWLVKEFHGRYQYLFIESICNDQKVLEQNYVFKMMFSPDYKGSVSAEQASNRFNTYKYEAVYEPISQAVNDFKTRVGKYEAVYEPISNRNVHYIKLIDMVTGRGYMDVNRISGYIPGKIVFFLMQVNEEYPVALSVNEEYPVALSVNEEYPVALSVWTSTLKRTIQTADNLPFPKLRWKALDEIQAGLCDGLTYKEIEERFPDEFEEIPSLKIPLHTLIELRPFPDGRMEVEHFPLHIPSIDELSRILPTDQSQEQTETETAPAVVPPSFVQAKIPVKQRSFTNWANNIALANGPSTSAASAPVGIGLQRAHSMLPSFPALLPLPSFPAGQKSGSLDAELSLAASLAASMSGTSLDEADPSGEEEEEVLRQVANSL
eukprot:gene9745-7620_t